MNRKGFGVNRLVLQAAMQIGKQEKNQKNRGLSLRQHITINGILKLEIMLGQRH